MLISFTSGLHGDLVPTPDPPGTAHAAHGPAGPAAAAGDRAAEPAVRAALLVLALQRHPDPALPHALPFRQECALGSADR